MIRFIANLIGLVIIAVVVSAVVYVVAKILGFDPDFWLTCRIVLPILCVIDFAMWLGSNGSRISRGADRFASSMPMIPPYRW